MPKLLHVANCHIYQSQLFCACSLFFVDFYYSRRSWGEPELHFALAFVCLLLIDFSTGLPQALLSWRNHFKICIWMRCATVSGLNRLYFWLFNMKCFWCVCTIEWICIKTLKCSNKVPLGCETEIDTTILGTNRVTRHARCSRIQEEH